MSKLNLLSTAAIAILISTSAGATSDETKHDPSRMQDQEESMMMNPQMMGEGHMQNMPMMNMQMMHQMMQQMHGMGHGQGHGQGHGYGHGHGMPMMGGGKGNMMMNPQMMQMRKQHMSNMEQSMKNIESLLEQLVELQKSE